MRGFIFLFLAGLLVGLFPTPTLAAARDVYATDVYQYSNQIYKPSNATNAPDSSYADFLEQDANVTLDLGETVESDLTMYITLIDFGATYRVEFYNADHELVDTSSDSFLINVSQPVVSFDGTEAYRYVKITSADTETWKLDAVQASVDEAIEEEEEIPVAEEEEVTAPEEIVRGQLIKIEDDMNATTSNDSAVYVVDSNNSRHAFPSETVFFSWYENFDNVVSVSAEQMASYSLGKNVTMRPGTNLLKITTDPKVYAVEPDGVLRWVSTEQIAVDLYGTDWADRVRDIPDVFWGNYQVGDPINSSIHPEGTLGVTEDGEVIYVHDQTYYTVPGSTYSYMRFRPDFYTRIADNLFESFSDLGGLGEDPDVAFPY